MSKTISISLIVLLCASLSQASWRKKIEVQESLRAELNSILKASSSLHLACTEGNEESIQQSMKEILRRIRRANRKSSLAQGQRPHLLKILSSVRTNIKMSQDLKGDQRKETLKNAFKDLVQMTQVFKLDRYKVFFCSKDKSVWLQKSSKPKNPIHPVKHAKCGRLVR